MNDYQGGAASTYETDPATGLRVIDYRGFVPDELEPSRTLRIRELDWAPGNYQWECPACRSAGNITMTMITEPSSAWHQCEGR